MSATDPHNPALAESQSRRSPTAAGRARHPHPGQSQAEQPLIPVPWRLPLALIGGAWALVAALFFTEFAAMADKWWNNETYAHGLVVVPLALWLMWRDRAALRETAPDPWPLAGLGVLALALMWLVGRAGDVIVVQQYAVMALLPASVLVLAGPALLRRWSFPLFFLLLAVPFGEFLVMPLMQLTADWTVALVRLTGIPVYREALSFSLPSGNWEVVEACSGIRYLIASVTLGLLYAYLTYRSIWRRLAFVAVAIIVPIVANSLRAYMIVMIGHLSDMQLAVGVDHLLYGWVFFGVVMLLMFWIGSFWREDAPRAAGDANASTSDAPQGADRRRLAAGAAVLLAVVLVAPALAGITDARVGAAPAMAAPPPGLAGWQAQAGAPSWSPSFPGASSHHRTTYADGGERAIVDVIHYRRQADGAELAGYFSRVVPENGGRMTERGRVSLPVAAGGGALEVPVLRITAPGGEELDIAYWYQLPNGAAPDPIRVKLYTTWQRLIGGTDGGSWASVAVPAPVASAPGSTIPAPLAGALAEHVRASLAGGRQP